MFKATIPLCFLLLPIFTNAKTPISSVLKNISNEDATIKLIIKNKPPAEETGEVNRRIGLCSEGKLEFCRYLHVNLLPKSRIDIERNQLLSDVLTKQCNSSNSIIPCQELAFAYANIQYNNLEIKPDETFLKTSKALLNSPSNFDGDKIANDCLNRKPLSCFSFNLIDIYQYIGGRKLLCSKNGNCDKIRQFAHSKKTNQKLCKLSDNDACVKLEIENRNLAALKKMCDDGNISSQLIACDAQFDLSNNQKYFKPSEKQILLSCLASLSGEACFENLNYQVSAESKKALLDIGCAKTIDKNAICADRSDVSRRFLLKCLLYSHEEDCLSFLYLTLENNKFNLEIDGLCKEGYPNSCSEVAKYLIEQKKVSEAVISLGTVCNKNLNFRASCLDLAAVQLKHGSFETASKAIQIIFDAGKLGNDLEYELETFKRIGPKRYESFMKGITEYIKAIDN